MNSSKISLVFCAVCFACLGVSAAELPILNASNGFGRIGSVTRAMASVKDGVLRIKDIKGDHSISFSVNPFFAGSVSSITIRYRAKGMESRGGQIFYAPSGVPYSDRRKFNIPRINPDGEWHVVELTEKDLVNVSDWRNTGTLDGFRLDMTDAAGGWIEISEIAFKGSAVNNSKSKVREYPPEALAVLDSDPWSSIEVETWEQVVDTNLVDAVSVRCLGGVAVPSVAKAGSVVKLMYDYVGKMPKPPMKVKVSMFTKHSLRWSEDVWAGPECFSRIGGNVWRLKLDYRLPVCLDSSLMTVRVDAAAIKCISGELPAAKLDFKRVDRIDGWEKPLRVRVCDVNGTTQFAVDGKPTYALWGTVRGDRLVPHSAAPLNFVTIWNTCAKWWPRGDEFDPAIMDYQAEWNIRQYPDAMFIWDISIYPPEDWRDANPDEVSQDDHGELNQDGRRTNFSFASKKALADMQKMMERAIRYLEQSPYANRIVGYRINSGHTVEWLGWNNSRSGRALDFSPVAKKGFEEFAKKYYPEIKNYTIPSLDERCAMDYTNCAVRDVKAHIRSVAYNDYYSTAVADFAVAMCRRAREIVGEDKLIGTYFGYVMTLMSTGVAQMRAHFSTKYFLDSLRGRIDFLMSPPAYHPENRALGETLVDMKPFSSILDYGIMPVIEDDTRTHNNLALPGTGYSQTKTERATVDMMRRNMGIAISRGLPFYTYAITSGSEFDFPKFAYDTATFRKIAQRSVERGVKRNAQVVVVVSEGFMKTIPDMRWANSESFPIGGQWHTAKGTVGWRDRTGGRPLVRDVYEGLYGRLSRVGVPVDYRFAEDLADNPGDYKLYIFSCCLLRDEKFVRVAKKLREKNCTIVWTYAPGYLGRDGNCVSSMCELTGLKLSKCEQLMDSEITSSDGTVYGKTGHDVVPLFKVEGDVEVLGKYSNGDCGFAAAKTGNARTIFYGAYHMNIPLLRKLVTEAGAHQYISTSDPIEANDSFVSLHVRFAGKKVIRLPKRTSVYDVFNDRLIAKDVAEFSIDAPLHSSWLFYCGDDAEDCVISASSEIR